MEAYLREAGPADIEYIVALSAQVHARLTRSGSRQVIGPIPPETAAYLVKNGSAFLLVVDGQNLGTVFVEPAGQSPALDAWGLADAATKYLFLHKLMVEPQAQGRGLGQLFLNLIKQKISARPGARLVLDCWAGNHKLREFYSLAGFRPHGFFREEDYEIAVMVWP